MRRPSGFRGTFRDDDEARAVYSEGAGVARIAPRAVAVPADEADVESLVAWAHATKTPLVPRGSGSGMAAGAIGDGIVVDLSRLRRIAPVDVTGMQIAVGPGVLRDEVDRLASAHGLRLPVDPSSGAFCTVGGMTATNAAGAHSLKHGPMRSWVSAADCVFDDGSRGVVRRDEPIADDIPAIARFLAGPDRRLRAGGSRWMRPGIRKNTSGYALDEYARDGELLDLIVGSEGTLAIIVGVELALAPVPGATASLLATFATLEEAVAGAGAAREAGASACELLDRTFLDVVGEASASEIPAGTEAVLLIEVEGSRPESATEQARALERAMVGAGASRVALGLVPGAEAAMWALRHAASPILSRLDPSLKSMQFIEDGAVPPTRLPEYVRGVRAALASHDVRGVIFGHAGDAHVHVNPLVDVSRPDWRARVDAVLDDVVELTARLGGTLAGEHGDGRLRAPLLARTWDGDTLAMFREIKRAFDPRGILNPGVKVPLPGQRPLGAIKYDPALAALPSAARRVLDRVERERAYAGFRLGMLEEGGEGR